MVTLAGYTAIYENQVFGREHTLKVEAEEIPARKIIIPKISTEPSED